MPLTKSLVGFAVGNFPFAIFIFHFWIPSIFELIFFSFKIPYRWRSVCSVLVERVSRRVGITTRISFFFSFRFFSPFLPRIVLLSYKA